MAQRAEDGRCFIGKIKRSELPLEDFPIEEGDELISFDGQKPAEVVAQLRAAIGKSVEDTDLALSSDALTHRRARGVFRYRNNPMRLSKCAPKEVMRCVVINWRGSVPPSEFPSK
ncbi:MAG: PDZ domain-containing protein [Myxococcota bacterium]